MASITSSPSSFTGGTTSQTVSVTGTGTSFTGTPFTLTGGFGASILSQTVASSTSATVVINPGVPGNGNLTLTDGGSGATSTITVISPSLGNLKIGWIGDSITAGTNGAPVTAAVAFLTTVGYTVTSVNQAVSGLSTYDWRPGGSYLPGALTAFASAGVTLVHIMLGTNDVRAPQSFSTATYFAQMTAIVSALRAAGLKVIISKPLWSTPNTVLPGVLWPPDPNAGYLAYFEACLALVDGQNVFVGDTGAFEAVQANPQLWLADGVHPANSTQNNLLGQMWAVGILNRYGGGGLVNRWSHSAGLPTTSVGSTTTSIAPDQVTSSTLTEYFVFDSDTVFSDNAFTTAATVGGTVGSVRGKNGLTTTLVSNINGGSANPTWAREPYSGRMGLLFNGSSTSIGRTGLAAKGTIFIVYAANPAGTPGAAQILMHDYSPSANIHVVWNGAITSTSQVALTYWNARSDSTITVQSTNGHFGTADVAVIRNDGTNIEIDRFGKAALSQTQAGTGNMTSGATLGALGTSANTSYSNWFKGYILAYGSYSGKISDSDMQGLSQWLSNFANKPPVQGRYLGLYFYGDGSDENSTSSVPAMVRSDDLTRWDQVPISAPLEITGTYAPFMPARDYGVAYDPACNAVFSVNTYQNGTLSLSKMSDMRTLRILGTINVLAATGSSTSGYAWAPEFVKNQDGSMWKDSNGLPRVVFAGQVNGGATGGGSNGFKLWTVKPNNTSWNVTTGNSNWATPVQVTFATLPADAIDASCVMTTDGTFHLFYVYRDGTGFNGSYVNHATATSIDGTFTTTGGNDPFSLGHHFESPQPIYRASDASWILHLDNQGEGYYFARSTTGIAGTYSTPVAITCPFIPQHGNMIPAPPGF